MHETHDPASSQPVETSSLSVQGEPSASGPFPGTESLEDFANAPTEVQGDATKEPSWLEKRKMRRQSLQDTSSGKPRLRLPWDVRIKIAVVASFLILVTTLIMNRKSGGGDETKAKTKIPPLASIAGTKPEGPEVLPAPPAEPAESESSVVETPPPLPVPTDVPDLDTPKTKPGGSRPEELVDQARSEPPVIEIVQTDTNAEASAPVPELQKPPSEEPATATKNDAPPLLDGMMAKEKAPPPALDSPPSLGASTPATPPKFPESTPPSAPPALSDTAIPADIPAPSLSSEKSEVAPSAIPADARPDPIPSTEVAAPTSSSSPIASGDGSAMPMPELPASGLPATVEPAPVAAQTSGISTPAEAVPSSSPAPIQAPALATPPPTEMAEPVGLYAIPNAGVKTSGEATAVRGTTPDPAMASPPTAPVARTLPDDFEPMAHVVRRGENFWTISRYHYGSGRFYKALWYANREIASSPEDLYVGSVIRIPPVEALNKAQIEPVPRSTDSGRIASGGSNAVQDARTKRVSNSETDGLIMLPTADPAHGVTEDIRPPTSSSKTARSLEMPTRSRVVRKHETLRSIARDELGDADREVEILSLNRNLESADDGVIRLRPGMTLKLPDDSRRR